ncbi:UPF0489 family protein [Flavobacterium sp. MMLR14_040]|uniref:UPF0489 family protein n=1 Tax=Flavobacterium sp. MMLR14_040 TaxID=3093843 RepID=UPI00298FC963|nr:UPF0489 family protein [Flavobacterium sp. MMLR14_040]MDW8848917.1 UPF0489 family protein [Flavobacterium sp. MMLR14_040]
METEQFELNNKQIFICEEHHHVLKFWRQYRAEQPYLVTFDHHTDLHRAFQGYLNTISYTGKRWESQAEWDLAQSKLLSKMIEDNWENINDLKHDEHIDAAINAGFIKKALVYSHDSYHNKPDRVFCINVTKNYSGQQVINNSQSYHEPSTIINGPELESRFRLFDLYIPREQWINNYILDIDLDFFQTKKSITPEDTSFFKMLIENAKGISIAKESGWIATWKREHDPSLSVEFLLERLLNLIKE